MRTLNSIRFRISISGIIVILLVSFLGCHSQDNRWLDEANAKAQAKRLKYDLQTPNRKMKLHNDLEEISGLSYAGNNKLLCVQDELGRVYYFNLKSEKIEESTKFAKSGDYEGVEIVADRIYVNRNDGKLYSFPRKLADPEKDDVEKIDTPLSEKNDIEGLAYLPSSNKLLLACKGSASVGNNSVKGKAIYSFDLTKNKFDKKPIFTIRKSDINAFISKHKKRFQLTKSPDFKPSGIAVHPHSKQIYVLASVGKALIILSSKGKIKDVAFLSEKIFKQPEGICFDPAGNLYIASEGVGGRGYILAFNYQP